MKRIVLVSHNDKLGGAAIVTYRLMRTLREMGYEADMLVFNKQSRDEHVHRIGNSFTRGLAFLRECAEIYTHNGFNRDNLFKISTGSTGISIIHHPLVRKADAIILNWINQATISLDEIKRLAKTGKRIIWTMHDMWCMTGVCHHARQCEHFTRKCGDCPLLGKSASRHDLSHHVWKAKKSLYDHAGITFVAISSWLKERAAESALLRDRDVVLIRNAFPSSLFPITPDRPYPNIGKLVLNKTIAFGAARLDDPIKGLDYAIDALNILYDTEAPETAGAVAVFFGAVNDPSVFNRLRFPYVMAGTLNTTLDLQYIYCRSVVVLSTSLYETLPTTLIEGMSSGAVPVSFGRGGQSDIIDHGVNGYLAKYLDAADIAEGIRWAFRAGIPREKLHQTVVEKFNAQRIANEYIELINRPCTSTKKDKKKAKEKKKRKHESKIPSKP